LAFIFALPHCDPLYEEFENSTPPPPQLPKIEAIQTSLFVDVLVTVFILVYEGQSKYVHVGILAI